MLDILYISNLYLLVLFLGEEPSKFSNFIKFILTFYQGMVSIITSSKGIFFLNRQESQDPLYAYMKMLFISYKELGEYVQFPKAISVPLSLYLKPSRNILFSCAFCGICPFEAFVHPRPQTIGSPTGTFVVTEIPRVFPVCFDLALYSRAFQTSASFYLR